MGRGGRIACHVTPDLSYDYVGGRGKQDDKDNKWDDWYYVVST